MGRITKIAILGGGTGGHIFPGLAIAHCFHEKNISVFWLGSKNGLEATLVPRHTIPVYLLSVRQLRGKSFLKKLLFPFQLSHAIYQAYKILKKNKPDLVISMGGFAAGPGGIAARLLHIPLYIHEQNSIAGLTNSYLAKLATTIFCGYPEAFTKKNNIIITGNPVRQEIQEIYNKKHHNNNPIHVLILGGSRGAKILNDIVPPAINLLPSELIPDIIHQTGELGIADYTNLPNLKNIKNLDIKPFINNIAQMYQWADVVICRAGALTLAELACAGLPAILIPYPHAADDHQTQNALFLANHGAAVLLPQSELTPDKLHDILKDLLINHSKRNAMALAAYQLRRENAAQAVVDACLSSDQLR